MDRLNPSTCREFAKERRLRGIRHPAGFMAIVGIFFSFLAAGPSESASRSRGCAHFQIARGEDLRNDTFGARRIVRCDDVSYIGYSERIGGTWYIRVRTYDHRTGKLGPVTDITSGTDDHSVMALTVDSHGVLHCVSGGHGKVNYMHTVHPRDVSAWTKPEAISSEGTYSMTVVDRRDRLYVFYRRDWIHLEMRSKPADGPWDPPVHIGTTTGNKGFYIMGIAIGDEPGQQSLHIVGHFYGEPEAYGLSWPKESYGYRIRPWYIRSLDGGTTWRKADGKVLVTPVADTAMDLLFDQSTPYDIPWSVDIALDAGNRPHIFCAWSERLPAPRLARLEVLTAIGREPSHIQEWTWENGSWRSRDVTVPSFKNLHISYPTAVFTGGRMHLIVATTESAAARPAGEIPTGRLWHLWSRNVPEIWKEELLDEFAAFANWKLPDSSGVLETIWRGRPEDGTNGISLYYKAWPAAGKTNQK